MPIRIAIAAALLTGCLDLNRPAALRYLTSGVYRISDPSSPANGIRIQWGMDSLGTVTFWYRDPGYLSVLADSLFESLVLYIESSPDLESGEDPATAADVRIRFFGPDTLGGALRMVGMRIDTRGEDGGWSRYYLGPPLTRDLGFYNPSYRTDFTTNLPADLLGSAPAFAWKVVRVIRGESFPMPREAGLFLRDEEAFIEEVYR